MVHVESTWCMYECVVSDYYCMVVCQMLIPLVKGCPEAVRPVVFSEIVIASIDACVDSVTRDWEIEAQAASAAGAAGGAVAGGGSGAAVAAMDIGTMVLLEHNLSRETAELLRVRGSFTALCLVFHS